VTLTDTLGTYKTSSVGKCVLREVSCNQTRDYIRMVDMLLLDHIRCELIVKRVPGETPVGFLLNQNGFVLEEMSVCCYHGVICVCSILFINKTDPPVQ
jgi:hypothetical protein